MFEKKADKDVEAKDQKHTDEKPMVETADSDFNQKAKADKKDKKPTPKEVAQKSVENDRHRQTEANVGNGLLPNMPSQTYVDERGARQTIAGAATEVGAEAKED